MKRLSFGILAIVGLFFAFSSKAEAATETYVELTNSKNTWTVEEGTDLTLYFKTFPREDKEKYHIGFNGFENGRMVDYCYAPESGCGTYELKNLKKGTYRIFYSLTKHEPIAGTTNRYLPKTIYTGVDKYIIVQEKGQLANISEVTLKANGEARIDSNGTKNFSLDATAKGTNIKTLKITREDDAQKTVSASCARMQTLCSLRIYPGFTSSDAGKTYVYQAVGTDANGNIKYSEKITVKVGNLLSGSPVPTLSTLKPTVTVTPNVSEISPTQKLTIKGNATNSNGVWGVEVRALPSWSNTALKNRCILSGKPTTGSCELEIGAFEGRSGQTVKVWTIYWDAKTGLGYSSEMKTIKIGNASSNTNTNQDLSLTAYAPRFAYDDERVTFTARSGNTLTSGRVVDVNAETINIYVNDRLVHTCSNTANCSYTGGPFGQNLTTPPTRVSYYATARIGTRNLTTPVQYTYLTDRAL